MRCSRSHKRDRSSHSSCCPTEGHSGAQGFSAYSGANLQKKTKKCLCTKKKEGAALRLSLPRFFLSFEFRSILLSRIFRGRRADHRSAGSRTKMRGARSHKRDRSAHSSCGPTEGHSGLCRCLSRILQHNWSQTYWYHSHVLFAAECHILLHVPNVQYYARLPSSQSLRYALFSLSDHKYALCSQTDMKNHFPDISLCRTAHNYSH